MIRKRPVKTPSLVALALACLCAGDAQARTLDDVFKPYAAVCVKFGGDGAITDALVDGSTADPALNAQVLALLRSYHSPYGPISVSQDWVSLYFNRSGKPMGAPVPEDPFRCP
jgi:hypothetical protein